MAGEDRYRLFDFTGGLASNYASEQLNNNEVSDTLNLVFDNRGNFKKRPGIKIHQDIPGTVTDAFGAHGIVMLYSFVKYKTGVEETIVMYANGVLKGFDGTNLYEIALKKTDNTNSAYVFQNATSGSSYLNAKANYPMAFTMNDKMYIIGPDNYAHRYNGRAGTGTALEVATRIDAMPKCSMVVIKNNRAFFAGDTQNPDYLYFSQLGDPESIAMTVNDKLHGGATVTGGGGIIRVPSEDAKITGIVEFNDALVIFKSDRAYTLTGRDPNVDFKLDILNVATGCIAPRTVVKGNNVVYWLSKEGVYYLSSPQQEIVEASPLSNKINNKINTSKISENSHAYFDGKKYHLVIDWEVDQHMLIFDEVNKSWYVYDFAPTVMEYSPKERDYYYVLNNRIVTLVDGQLKDEVQPNVYEPINSLLKTANYRLDEPETTKRFRWVMVFFKPNSVENSQVDLKVSIDYKDSYRSINSQYIGMMWGSGEWGRDYWGTGKDEVNQMVRFGGSGKTIQFTFENNRIDEDMEIHGFVIGFKKKPRAR